LKTRRTFFTPLYAVAAFFGLRRFSKASPGWNGSIANSALPGNLSRFDEAERLTVSLAGCSVAALGGTKPEVVAKRTDWAWTPAYQDVLDLRRKYDSVVRHLSDTMPIGNAVMVYPCGCSANGAATPGVPRYCSEHDTKMERENQCSVIKSSWLDRPKPTIAELEEILARNPQPPTQIMPNGEVRAV
jgi:hypothetical protein